MTVASTGRVAGLDGALEHRRLASRRRPPGRAWAGLGHRRMRRPAYFSPARRRPPGSSQPRKATATSASGGRSTARTASEQRGGLHVEGERGGAPPRPAERGSAGRGSGRPAGRSARTAGRRGAPATRWPVVVERAGAEQRAGPMPTPGARPRPCRARSGAKERRERRAPLRRPAEPAGSRGTRRRCRRSPRRGRRPPARRRPARAGTGAGPPRRGPIPCRMSSTSVTVR